MAPKSYTAAYLLLQLSFINAARILSVYPIASISHQVVFRPITLELIMRGHEVVVITPDPMFPKGGKAKPPQNLTEVDIHDVSYGTLKAFQEAARGSKNNLVAQVQGIATMMIENVDKQFQVDEVKKIIKGKQTFDLILTEAMVRQALAVSYVYKVPVIKISSFGAIFGNNEAFGIPTHPLLYPAPFSTRLYNLTIYEKLNELYLTYINDKIINVMVDGENKNLKKHFGPNIPDIRELQNNVDMLFLNVHPIWDGSRPVPPNVIYMGGLPQKPNKELPMDLKTYLDSSKQGVIYFSLGTNVKPSMLPQEQIQVFVRTFSKLPYDVLWKWDKDLLLGKSDNIRLSKWLPQSDLLKHPKVKLFITQGGLQSTDEAITAGVPLIGIPMLGDQWYNTEKYVYHGIGLQLELETLSEELFKKAITTVIDDESYRNNIIKLRGLMLDQPQTPLERAIWWIEYVLRHGGAKHLRSPAANISWSQYLELELVATVLSVLILLFLALIGIVYCLYRFVTNIFIVNSKEKKS